MKSHGPRSFRFQHFEVQDIVKRFLLHHCAEVASHMFELAVLAHTSFTPHKGGNSPVCELEMLAVSTSTLGRNGESHVCQRMR